MDPLVGVILHELGHGIGVRYANIYFRSLTHRGASLGSTSHGYNGRNELVLIEALDRGPH